MKRLADAGILLFVAVGFLASSARSWAWPPTYGAEFEFTSEAMLEGTADFSGLEKPMVGRFGEILRAKCASGDCAYSIVQGKWAPEPKVTFADGWWFKVSYDPGCVEIQTAPATLEQLKRYQARMEEYIFSIARSLGLGVDYEVGAGHFNFGASATFGVDAKLFTRFMADYQNHPELALGGLGNDTYNAPPLSVLGQDQRDAFQDIVTKVNAGTITSVRDVARATQNNVYTRSAFKDMVGYHYQAIGLKKLNGYSFPATDAPEELRAIYPQESAEQFIRLAELIEARVAYLRTETGPVRYLNRTETEFTPQELVDAYYVYVREMGLSWDEYRVLLAPNLRRRTPNNFLSGKGTWGNPVFEASVMKYSSDIDSSPYVRQRLKTVLSEPGAHSSFIGKRVLREWASSPESSPSKLALMSEILATPAWQAEPAASRVVMAALPRQAPADASARPAQQAQPEPEQARAADSRHPVQRFLEETVFPLCARAFD